MMTKPHHLVPVHHHSNKQTNIRRQPLTEHCRPRRKHISLLPQLSSEDCCDEKKRRHFQRAHKRYRKITKKVVLPALVILTLLLYFMSGTSFKFFWMRSSTSTTTTIPSSSTFDSDARLSRTAYESIIQHNKMIDELPNKPDNTRSYRSQQLHAEKNSKLNNPRYIHYIFISMTEDQFQASSNNAVIRPKAFPLVYYLNIRAAYTRLNPRQIFMYVDVEPIGPFWKLLSPLVTVVRLRKMPSTVFGNEMRSIEELADVLRLRALLQHGGIYLDLDVIPLKSFDHLLSKSDATSTDNIVSKLILGKEDGLDEAGNRITEVGNSIIISNAQNEFLSRWYRSYETLDAAQHSRSYHSKRFPWELSRVLPNHVRILDSQQFYAPLWTREGIHTLFEEDSSQYDANLAVHLWGSKSWEAYVAPSSFHRIISVNTTFHRLLRPAIPTPLFSVILTCGSLSDIQASIKSITNQEFALYEILVVVEKSTSCTSRVQSVLKKNSSNVLVTFVTREDFREAANGAWTIFLKAGNVLPPAIFVQAQDYLVSHPESFLEETKEFRQFEFKERSAVVSVLPRITFPCRYGPFPEMNPHATHGCDSHHTYSKSVLSTTTRPFTSLFSLWPGQISARAYRNLIFQNEQRLVREEVETILSHIRVWKKCVEERKPNLVSLDDGSSFNTEEFHEVLQDLPVEFGLLYLGSDKTVVSSNEDPGLADLDGESSKVSQLFELNTSNSFSAYFISPRMADLLLSEVYPIELTLPELMTFVADKYKCQVYIPNSPMSISNNSSSDNPIVVQTTTKVSQVHVIHLGANELWKHYVADLPSDGGSLLAGPALQDVVKKHWNEEDALTEEGSGFTNIVASSAAPPHYELKLLHFKLTLLLRYGGIVIDAGFGSDRVLGVGTYPLDSIAMFRDESGIPKFPLMIAASNTSVEHVANLRDALFPLLQTNVSTVKRLKRGRKAITKFVSAVEESNTMQVFPVGILFE